MTPRQTFTVWIFFIALLLGIVGITLGPVATDCWMSWGEFFAHASARIGLFVVLASFWLEALRRFWNKDVPRTASGTASTGRAGPIIVAWCGLLTIPLFFWIMMHLFSTVSATHPNANELRRYEMKVQGGNIQTMRQIGGLYEKGNGVPRNYQMAMLWYKRAASMGDARAMVDISALYEHGLGWPKNYRLAVPWYRLGAKAAPGRAMFHIGELFDEGRGVAKDHKAGVAWWRRAARANNAAAKKKLAQLGLPIYATSKQQTP